MKTKMPMAIISLTALDMYKSFIPLYRSSKGN